jgi:hypothetical protein
MISRALFLAASIAIGGCAALDDYGSVSRQNVTDAEGNVAGFKQILHNKRTGEIAAQVRHFRPIRNDKGELVGYEEQTPDGAVIRDLSGRQIGARFADLRSRSTNSRSNGFTLIIGSLDSRRVVTDSSALAAPRLTTSISAADLDAIR